MIRVLNAEKRFDRKTKALDSLCIHVNKGSIYGLVGTNGAGKTTVIRSIMGILQLDAGEITLDGAPVYDNPKAKQRIGYVSDDPFAFRGYSLREMAAYTAGIYEGWNEERFARMSAEFALDPKGKLSSFSKGMRKQAALILALSVMPDVLVLDEPIDGLDPLVRRKVWKYIIDDVAEREMTVLVSSHNLREMEDYCDHIGIIADGHMVIERDLEDLKSDVHKVQAAFPGGADVLAEIGSTALHVLHHERRGSVDIAIIRESEETIRRTLAPYEPVLLDLLPLTLEEIFVYELGGATYEIDNIIK
ncbi:MAG: ABC transporter ATP-binding protein [Firmicutes bacterium]|nr:ABC transporter ATP-binding protein [Bacillota bacterium]